MLFKIVKQLENISDITGPNNGLMAVTSNNKVSLKIVPNDLLNDPYAHYCKDLVVVIDTRLSVFENTNVSFKSFKEALSKDLLNYYEIEADGKKMFAAIIGQNFDQSANPFLL